MISIVPGMVLLPNFSTTLESTFREKKAWSSGCLVLMSYCSLTRLHLPICCWVIRQWRDCHLLHAANLCLVDQVCENWFTILVNLVCSGLLLHGKFTQLNLLFLSNIQHILSLNSTNALLKRNSTRRRNSSWSARSYCLLYGINFNETNFSCLQVSSWGGYVFLINLIPLHVLALMITGRFSHRIYVAYCSVSKQNLWSLQNYLLKPWELFW